MWRKLAVLTNCVSHYSPGCSLTQRARFCFEKVSNNMRISPFIPASDTSISEINSDFCERVSSIVFLLFRVVTIKIRTKVLTRLFRTVSFFRTVSGIDSIQQTDIFGLHFSWLYQKNNPRKFRKFLGVVAKREKNTGFSGLLLMRTCYTTSLE